MDCTCGMPPYSTRGCAIHGPELNAQIIAGSNLSVAEQIADLRADMRELNQILRALAARLAPGCPLPEKKE